MRKKRPSRLAAALLILPLMVGGLPRPALAGMIGTEAVLTLEKRVEQIDRLRALMAREEAQSALIALGVDPGEAAERVEALTDEELSMLQEELDALPAGGSSALAVIGVVFLVLLILELTGVIDIFKKL